MKIYKDNYSKSCTHFEGNSVVLTIRTTTSIKATMLPVCFFRQITSLTINMLLLTIIWWDIIRILEG